MQFRSSFEIAPPTGFQDSRIGTKKRRTCDPIWLDQILHLGLVIYATLCALPYVRYLMYPTLCILPYVRYFT